MAHSFNTLADALKMSSNKISNVQQNIKSKIRSLDAISTSASGALSGDFVNSQFLITDAFNDPNNTFIDHGDGTYQIVRDGTVIGYTKKDNVVGNMSINSNSQFSDAKIDAYDQRDSGNVNSGSTVTSTDRYNQYMDESAANNSQSQSTMTSNNNVWTGNAELKNPFDLAGNSNNNVNMSAFDIETNV